MDAAEFVQWMAYYSLQDEKEEKKIRELIQSEKSEQEIAEQVRNFFKLIQPKKRKNGSKK